MDKVFKRLTNRVVIILYLWYKMACQNNMLSCYAGDCTACSYLEWNNYSYLLTTNVAITDSAFAIIDNNLIKWRTYNECLWKNAIFFSMLLQSKESVSIYAKLFPQVTIAITTVKNIFAKFYYDMLRYQLVKKKSSSKIFTCKASSSKSCVVKSS